MDIDLTSIDYKNVDIPFFLKFAGAELKKHISLVKNRDYREIAFTTSNENNFKRFFEEIIPLMFFLERQRDIFSKIKYMSGNQKGDAILDDSITVEITKAQNNNQYLVTQDLLNHGRAFSPKNIKNESSSSLPTKTQPYVYKNFDHIKDAALYIRQAIDNKLKKNYPNGSILIITLKMDVSLVWQDEFFRLEKEIVNFGKGIFSKIYIILEYFFKDNLQQNTLRAAIFSLGGNMDKVEIKF
jgi:hypothetical protein